MKRKTIELFIKDRFDLHLMIGSLNLIQHIAKKDLANHNSGNDKIESDWIRETVDEWDRIQSLKSQLITEITKEEEDEPNKSKR